MINEFTTGQVVSVDGHPYRSEGVIKGGMGLVVFLSSTKLVNSEIYRDRVAAKVFSPIYDEALLRNEMAIWRKINHPHSALLLGIGYANDYLCGLMPWFTEGAIDHSRMPDAHRARLVKRMLQHITLALDYSWQTHRIAHCDIKPANILMRLENYYLTDWGIARIVPCDQIHRRQPIAGTLPYMAPELFTGSTPAPSRDIYALGITALQLMTNRLPYEGASSEDVVDSILNGTTFSRISDLTTSLPPQWRKLIIHCCQPTPDLRISSYTEIRRSIDSLEEYDV